MLKRVPILRRIIRNIEFKRKFCLGNNIQTKRIAMTASLGKNVFLAKGVSIRDRVEIGDNSYCNQGTILFNGTKVGKFCSIGYNVQIGLPEHPASFFSTNPNVYRNKRISYLCDWPLNDFKTSVKIGNDVWIGSNVCILQGVTIGDGAIIAAGAVVTESVPSYEIWGGVKARFLKKRFDDYTIKFLLESKWWDKDMDYICQFARKMYDKNKIN